jgi:hypothetical protein
LIASNVILNYIINQIKKPEQGWGGEERKTTEFQGVMITNRSKKQNHEEF